MCTVREPTSETVFVLVLSRAGNQADRYGVNVQVCLSEVCVFGAQ